MRQNLVGWGARSGVFRYDERSIRFLDLEVSSKRFDRSVGFGLSVVTVDGTGRANTTVRLCECHGRKSLRHRFVVED